MSGRAVNSVSYSSWRSVCKIIGRQVANGAIILPYGNLYFLGPNLATRLAETDKKPLGSSFRLGTMSYYTASVYTRLLYASKWCSYVNMKPWSYCQYTLAERGSIMSLEWFGFVKRSATDSYGASSSSRIAVTQSSSSRMDLSSSRD